MAPGVTRAYNKVVVKGVPGTAKKVFNFLAKRLLSSGIFHALGHGLIDQVPDIPNVSIYASFKMHLYFVGAAFAGV